MKKIVVIIVLVSLGYGIKAQDIIYTIGAELNEINTELDSILVENLSNGKHIVFNNLPKQEYYQINLSKKILLGTVGVGLLENNKTFAVIQNIPGLLRIRYENNNVEDAIIKVYNINGQQIYTSEKVTFEDYQLFQIRLNISGVFFVRIETSRGNQNFKAVGSAEAQNQIIEILEAEGNLKSLFKNMDEFTFNFGDQLRFSVFKDDYFALPSMLYINHSQELDFTFSVPFKDDRDNRIYKTVKIGDQTWMAENLSYLPAVSLSNAGSLTEKHYYVYGYEYNSIVKAKNTINYGIYGVLYNWTAAMNEAESSDLIPSEVQGVCPSGWHLPSKSEWTILIDYLSNNGFGYENSDNTIAKAIAAKTNWNYSAYHGTPGNEIQSNNLTGFNALPGGYRSSHDEFRSIELGAFWWSSTENGSNYAEYFALLFDFDVVTGSFSSKAIGFPVRCVRD